MQRDSQFSKGSALSTCPAWTRVLGRTAAECGLRQGWARTCGGVLACPRGPRPQAPGPTALQWAEK